MSLIFHHNNPTPFFIPSLTIKGQNISQARSTYEKSGSGSMYLIGYFRHRLSHPNLGQSPKIFIFPFWKIGLHLFRSTRPFIHKEVLHGIGGWHDLVAPYGHLFNLWHGQLGIFRGGSIMTHVLTIVPLCRVVIDFLRPIHRTFTLPAIRFLLRVWGRLILTHLVFKY